MDKNFSWADIYQKYSNTMLLVIRRYLTDKSTAEDILHEGFMKAMDKHDQYSGRGSFYGWLKRIIINTTLQRLRQRNKEIIEYGNENDTSLEEASASEETEKSVIEHADFSQEELLHVIEMLPPQYRMVFNLYVLDGFKHKEISKEMGITVGTSKSYLARARKKLFIMLFNRANKKKRSPKVAAIAFFGGDSVDHIYRESFKEEENQMPVAHPLDVLKGKEVKVITRNRLNSHFGTLPIVSVLGSFFLGAGSMLLVPNSDQEAYRVNIPVDTVQVIVTDTVQVSGTITEDSVIQKENQKPPTIIIRQRIVKKDTLYVK